MAIIRFVITAICASAFAVSSALADGHEPTISMVSIFDVKPAKEKQFDAAWMTIKEVAEANDYPYTEMAGGWRNMRWIVTPINSFADVDAVMAARNAVNEAGGRKFDKAFDKFNDALAKGHTFFTHWDKELSYTAEGDEGGPYMEIDSYFYAYGEKDEMTEILAAIKAMAEEKNSPYSYQVNWDGIGSPGNSFTIIKYAADAVAMAERNAAVAKMFEGDDDAQAVFDRFAKIATGSQTMLSNFNAEASINMSMGAEE